MSGRINQKRLHPMGLLLPKILPNQQSPLRRRSVGELVTVLNKRQRVEKS